MKCPACQRQVLSRAKYCQECGFDLQDEDLSLQRITGSQSRPIYLQQDAQLETIKEIYLRAQNEKSGSRRKIVTLFADISGFTKLCENRDAEEVAESINQFFNELAEIVDRHGGYVDKFIGDCLMALFGAPISYEDNASRALQAAIEMQECTPQISQTLGVPISLSIGINEGEAVVGHLGSKLKSQYTAIGDNVNIAQRLQSQATAGQILIGESIFLDRQSEFDFESLGEISVKGKSKKLKVFQLLGQNTKQELTPENSTDSVSGNLAKLDALNSVDREFLKVIGVLGAASHWSLIKEIFPDAVESYRYLEQNGWLEADQSKSGEPIIKFKSDAMFETLRSSILKKDREALIISASDRLNKKVKELVRLQKIPEAVFWTGQLVRLEEAFADPVRLAKAVEGLAFLHFRSGKLQNAYEEIKRALEISKSVGEEHQRLLKDKILKMSDFLKSQNQTEWSETFKKQLSKF